MESTIGAYLASNPCFVLKRKDYFKGSKSTTTASLNCVPFLSQSKKVPKVLITSLEFQANAIQFQVADKTAGTASTKTVEVLYRDIVSIEPKQSPSDPLFASHVQQKVKILACPILKGGKKVQRKRKVEQFELIWKGPADAIAVEGERVASMEEKSHDNEQAEETFALNISDHAGQQEEEDDNDKDASKPNGYAHEMSSSMVNAGTVIQYIAEQLAKHAQLSHCLTGKKKQYLVLLNPVGGAGKAKKIFETVVKPFYVACGIELEIKYSEYANHAKEIALNLPLGTYDCVVVVGGDGFLSEVMQGFMNRSDWKKAMQQPIGIIPAGSGNGLSKEVTTQSQEEWNAFNCAFITVKGSPKKLDMATISNEKNEKFYSFLSLEWACIANIDIDSEKFRFMGSARFSVSGLAQVLNGKKWAGKFSFLKSSDSDGTAPYQYEDVEHENDQTSPEISLLRSSDPSEWEVIEGKFAFFWAMNTSYASHDALVAPGANMNDGYMHVMYINKSVSKLDLANVLLDLETGNHVNRSYVSMIKTRAFKLEPANKNDLVAVDGEVFEGERFEVEVHRGLGTIVNL